jgi:tripeptide aminopeptidase
MPVWKLDPAHRQELLERFLRYVAVDTRSDDDAACYPSTEAQKDLARMLVRELLELGCADAAMDPWGYVQATVPGNLPSGHPAAGKVPVLGFLAHLDTYHGTPGAGVRPQVIPAYAGGDIPLPGDPAQTLTPAAHPALAQCLGHTLVTSDGTTLLGADDKAGIAEIMTLVAWLGRHPEFPHGELKVGFTPDEEVGRGTEHFDVARFGARFAYTLDGAALGEVEDENFSADAATVVIEGHDVHPGRAKGVMVNALRVAAALVAGLPQHELPETTEGREPFLHPISLQGDVSRAELKLLVRAFSETGLAALERGLEALGAGMEARFPGARVHVAVKQSYRNMAARIAEHPEVLEYALEAVRRQGIEPVRRAIRGGTDGARLSFMGLPTPNLFTGGQAFHSVQEWASLDWMAAAVEVCLQLLTVWTERG